LAIAVILIVASLAWARCGNLQALDNNFSLAIGSQPASADSQARLFVEEWQSYIPPFGCDFAAAAEFDYPSKGISVTVVPVPSGGCPALHCLDVYCPPGAGGERSSSCFIAQGQGAANIAYLVNATAENATPGTYTGSIVWRDESADTLEKITRTKFAITVTGAPATPTPEPTAKANATASAAAPTATPKPPAAAPLLPISGPRVPSLTVEQIIIAIAAGVAFLLIMLWQSRHQSEEY